MKLNMNGANGDVQTTVSTCNGGVADANSKKPRNSRLTNQLNSPATIKIEDDSDEETLENKINNVSLSGVGKIDKSVQTDESILLDAVRRIVQQRMHQYEVASMKDQCIDGQLSPLLEKLQRENEELKKYGVALKTQLDQKEKEKQSLKRRYGEMMADKSPVVRPPGQMGVPPPANNAAIATSPSTPTQLRMIRPQHQQLPPPPQLNPTPQQIVQHPAGNSTRLTSTIGYRPNGQGLSAVRQVAPGQQQQVAPGPQAPPNYFRHPFAPNERFILVSNSNITMNNANAPKVVAANQGQSMRMAVMSPETATASRPPALDANMRPMMPNNPQQQFMQRMTIRQPQSNPAIPPLRAAPPNLNRPGPPAAQNVPNIAVPFTQLPKLTAAISTSNNAIVLTWDYHERIPEDKKEQYKVECYQLFAHQGKDARIPPPLDTKQWKKIGVVNALPLPMACTLTQFASGSVYFFSVVAVDIHGREGEMSNACVIRLDVNGR